MWPFRRRRAPSDQPAAAHVAARDVEPAGWTCTPALQRTVGSTPSTFKIGAKVREDLVAPQPTRLSGALLHDVSASAPSGTVLNLALGVGRPSLQRIPDGAAALTLRPPAPSPTRPGETSEAWSAADPIDVSDAPPVWQLPSALEMPSARRPVEAPRPEEPMRVLPTAAGVTPHAGAVTDGAGRDVAPPPPPADDEAATPTPSNDDNAGVPAAPVEPVAPVQRSPVARRSADTDGSAPPFRLTEPPLRLQRRGAAAAQRGNPDVQHDRYAAAVDPPSLGIAAQPEVAVQRRPDDADVPQAARGDIVAGARGVAPATTSVPAAVKHPADAPGTRHADDGADVVEPGVPTLHVARRASDAVTTASPSSMPPLRDQTASRLGDGRRTMPPAALEPPIQRLAAPHTGIPASPAPPPQLPLRRPVQVQRTAESSASAGVVGASNASPGTTESTPVSPLAATAETTARPEAAAVEAHDRPTDAAPAPSMPAAAATGGDSDETGASTQAAPEPVPPLDSPRSAGVGADSEAAVVPRAPLAPAVGHPPVLLDQPSPGSDANTDATDTLVLQRRVTSARDTTDGRPVDAVQRSMGAAPSPHPAPDGHAAPAPMPAPPSSDTAPVPSRAQAHGDQSSVIAAALPAAEQLGAPSVDIPSIGGTTAADAPATLPLALQRRTERSDDDASGRQDARAGSGPPLPAPDAAPAAGDAVADVLGNRPLQATPQFPAAATWRSTPTSSGAGMGPAAPVQRIAGIASRPPSAAAPGPGVVTRPGAVRSSVGGWRAGHAEPLATSQGSAFPSPVSPAAQRLTASPAAPPSASAGSSTRHPVQRLLNAGAVPETPSTAMSALALAPPTTPHVTTSQTGAVPQRTLNSAELALPLAASAMRERTSEQTVQRQLDTAVGTALAAGVANRAADGSISFAPRPESAPPSAVETASTPPPPEAPVAGGAGGATTLGGDLDELAKQLYDRIRWRLRTELRLDMERAGRGAGLAR